MVKVIENPPTLHPNLSIVTNCANTERLVQCVVNLCSERCTTDALNFATRCNRIGLHYTCMLLGITTICTKHFFKCIILTFLDQRRNVVFCFNSMKFNNKCCLQSRDESVEKCS